MFDKNKVAEVLIQFRKEHEVSEEAPAVIFQLIYDICMALSFTQAEGLALIGPYAAEFNDLPPYITPLHSSPAANLRDLRLLIEDASDGRVGIVTTALLWSVCKAVNIEEDLRPYVVGLDNYDEWMLTQVIL